MAQWRSAGNSNREARVRVTFRTPFFFVCFGLDIMKVKDVVFGVRQKSLRLIQKNIEPCQYRNISISQYCVMREYFVFTGWLTGAFDCFSK